MTYKKYTSSDFGKTASTFEAFVPQRLIHKNTDQTKMDLQFSAIREHAVQIIDLPTNSISMTIGSLLPNQQSNRHRHTYETIAYILQGRGYSMIEDEKIFWEKGDAIYIPNWAWHHHVNIDSSSAAKYLACENAPMLQNLGLLAIREES